MKSSTWFVNDSLDCAHSSFSVDTLGILSRYQRRQRVAFTHPGLLLESRFSVMGFSHLLSFELSLTSKVSCIASIVWIGYYAFSVVAPWVGCEEHQEGGLKTKNPWDWMATRITSETENSEWWTVWFTLHRCLSFKQTDSVNAFEVWFDCCFDIFVSSQNKN